MILRTNEVLNFKVCIFVCVGEVKSESVSDSGVCDSVMMVE
jgi:hypothetical protein